MHENLRRATGELTSRTFSSASKPSTASGEVSRTKGGCECAFGIAVLALPLRGEQATSTNGPLPVRALDRI